MMKIKFSMRNTYQADEIREILAEQGMHRNAIDGATDEIYSRFHEILFELDFDDTGNMIDAKFRKF